MDAEIIAINPASIVSHQSYCAKKGFSFDILSDSDSITAKRYHSLKIGGLLIQRSVYVIGPEATVIFAKEGMPPNQEMLDAIAAYEK